MFSSFFLSLVFRNGVIFLKLFAASFASLLRLRITILLSSPYFLICFTSSLRRSSLSSGNNKAYAFAVVCGVQAKVRFKNCLLHFLEHRGIPNGNKQHARLRNRNTAHLIYRSLHSVILNNQSLSSTCGFALARTVASLSLKRRNGFPHFIRCVLFDCFQFLCHIVGSLHDLYIQ